MGPQNSRSFDAELFLNSPGMSRKVVPKQHMIRLLHQQHALADRLIAHMLARNSRLEEDLIDQLFNASEKRLARTLLLLARYGKPDGPRRVLPKISRRFSRKWWGRRDRA